MTVTKTDFNSIAAAIEQYGETDVLAVINQGLSNRAYRKGYTKQRNQQMREAFRIVKAAQSDPAMAEALGLGVRR